ncbi:Uncharacterised protein [Mycobacteroides abscessus subsp. abscessus]|nr:Uncharacterised protein [Mycobacteroides abscessus subsp. abscessus]
MLPLVQVHSRALARLVQLREFRLLSFRISPLLKWSAKPNRFQGLMEKHQSAYRLLKPPMPIRLKLSMM